MVLDELLCKLDFFFYLDIQYIVKIINAYDVT